jgi:Ser/Thr protein kinase RdoA (MazF antagonist)
MKQSLVILSAAKDLRLLFQDEFSVTGHQKRRARMDWMPTELNITHGLDGTLVEPDWPPLILDEVRDLMRFYPSLGNPSGLLTVSPRPLSAASVVAMEAGQIFVKRHHCAVRDVEGLSEEHRFMAYLRANGMPVPRVFAAESGETAIKIGDSTYEIHEVPPGIDLYKDAISWTPFRSENDAYSAGQMLARLHQASHGYDAPARTNRQLVAGFTIFASENSAGAFNRYVAARPALGTYLETRSCRDDALDLLEPFHRELLPLLAALRPLWTHNDWHASNLMWSVPGADARATAVIDFGLADRTNVVHDLAHAIERNIVDWLALVNDPAHPEKVSIHFDHLSALLDGYESMRPLAHEESLALAPMVALCHAEFALSETDYFLSVLHSDEKAWYACEGYLVAHARWFRNAGRTLLDALRARATRSRSMRGVAAQ